MGAAPLMERWNVFLGEIASGTKLPDAMMKALVTRADIETCVRSDPAQAERWDQARLAKARTAWPQLRIDAVLEHIAGGATIERALNAEGVDRKEWPYFLRIITQDPIVHGQYRRALESRALLMGEEVLAIADENTNDWTDRIGRNGEVIGRMIDHEVVNRSKLRVETRLKLMSSWYGRMFAEKKPDVQVNVQVNHAERLEEARHRRDTRTRPTVSPEALRAAVDATFTEGKPKEDTSWLDVPEALPDTSAPQAALDATWLESP